MTAPLRIHRRTILQLPLGVAAAGTALSVASAAGATDILRPTGRDAWQFGLMCDTQWGPNADGENPGTIAGGLQRMINERMIEAGVDFVIQVGDNVDREDDRANGDQSRRTLPIKGELVQPLYDAGIGFYSLRGNHESSKTAAQEFPAVFPQNLGEGANPLAGATNFSSPSEQLRGLSYSFDVKNVRIIMLDQFTRPDGASGTILDQLDWIEERIQSRDAGMHCIVAGHKNLIGGNHVDCLFGANPASNPEAVSRFLRMCDEGGVAFVWGGHDHHHKRSLVEKDGFAVEQLIAGSDSAKFYTPSVPSVAERFPEGPAETLFAEELWTLTHYVVTVDGPILTVDMYSMSTGQDYGPAYMGTTPPETGWFWRERWGYGQNGTDVVIGQGESYTAVRDEFDGTTAAIIDGVNTSEATDFAGRKLSKHVATAWEKASRGDESARLHLLGMHANLALHDQDLTGLYPDADGTEHGDAFVLRMSAGAAGFRADGTFGIAAQDADGRWVNAVELNAGGTRRFVRGAYRKGMGLGAYGVDPRTKCAWAVLDRGGVFALRRGI